MMPQPLEPRRGGVARTRRTRGIEAVGKSSAPPLARMQNPTPSFQGDAACPNPVTGAVIRIAALLAELNARRVGPARAQGAAL